MQMERGRLLNYEACFVPVWGQPLPQSITCYSCPLLVSPWRGSHSMDSSASKASLNQCDGIQDSHPRPCHGGIAFHGVDRAPTMPLRPWTDICPLYCVQFGPVTNKTAVSVLRPDFCWREGVCFSLQRKYHEQNCWVWGDIRTLGPSLVSPYCPSAGMSHLSPPSPQWTHWWLPYLLPAAQ